MSQYFGKAVHVAYVVPDINTAMQRMVDSGIGPVYAMRRVRVAARYRGQRSDVLITAAFVYSGAMQFEFVEQHDDAPSAYRDYIAMHPEGGMHHVAYFCDGLDGARKKVADRFDLVQEFIGPDEVAYEIYLAPKNNAYKADPLQVQLMLHGPMDPFFAQMERAAATWDGRDPIRNALDLLPPAMRPPQELR